MLDKVIKLMYEYDPYTNWALIKGSEGGLKDMLFIIYNWIDEKYLEETEEITDIINYLEEQTII